MTKLFEQTIPEMAMGGAAIVLLDEVETLAVSRHKLSLDANPQMSIAQPMLRCLAWTG